MRQTKMPDFVRGMYATILGVSFFKVAYDNRLAWRPAKNYKEIRDFFCLHFLDFFCSPIFFSVLSFVFTLVILAHDWFSYHAYKKLKADKREKFLYYVPQILALFCLAGMFDATVNVNLKYWYIFAFWYTVCNIVNVWLNKTVSGLGYLKYLIHFVLVIISFWLVPFTFSAVPFLVSIVITIGVVFGIWWLEGKNASEAGQKPDLAETQRILATLVDDNHLTAEVSFRNKHIEDLKAKGTELENIKAELEEKKTALEKANQRINALSDKSTDKKDSQKEGEHR